MKSRSLILIALAAVLAQSAESAIVSVNLTEFATDIQQIDSDETFGVAAYGSVTGGWVNLNQTLNATNLADSGGTATTVDVSITAPNQWATFNAAYDDTPIKSGVDHYTGTANPATVTLSDLSATFPSGYLVVVYVGGFNANSGASISDGATTYYYQAADSPSAPVSFVQTTDTTDDGDNTAPEAQYAVFGSASSPLTSNSLTLTLDTLYGGGSAIGGFQVVAVPEPSVFPLFVAALLPLFARRRRC